jgi:predicted O-methyltransferase YrrM
VVDRPPLVQKALSLANALGFDRSCEDDVGRLLRTLAATVGLGAIVGEIGTGFGVGTAWILGALPGGARLVTVENDPARADAARALFAGRDDVDVIFGDWREIVPHGPFDLLFADAKPAKDDPDTLLDALKPRGIVVLDDIHGRWPTERGEPEPTRTFWLNDPRVAATEVGIDYGPSGFPGSAIVAVRLV